MKKIRINRNQTIFVIFALLTGLAFIYSPFAMTWQTQAAGTISGRVFQDYNANGLYDTAGGTAAVDKGLAGITVTAYDSAGAAQGTATTAADGTYSLAATGTGPYRVEFTNLPANFLPSARSTDSVSGGTATEAGSTVQFVTDGNTSNVNLGINLPNEYCQNTPTLITTCFLGSVGGSTSDPVLVEFPYDSGTTSTSSSVGVTTPTTHALAVPQSTLGSIWGLAYHRRSQQIFSAAFTKRHSGFRNDVQGSVGNVDPTGEIFISNTTGNTASVFINLNTLFGTNATAGVNPHDVADYFNDTTAFDAVGKTAFGDIALSEDEETLFVVNLADRSLYSIPIGSGTPTAPTVSTQVTVYDLVTLAGASATCPASADLRPGALSVNQGTLYYGLTCTAQTSGTSADLRAFVYSLDLAGAGTATQVVNVALDYPRGCVSDNGTVCADAEWLPWISSAASLLDYAPYSQKYYPQPWLLDIEFDRNGFMLLGISDRVGHQTGNDRSTSGPVEGVSAGDTLRLTPGGGTWALEVNASDGTNTTAGQNNGEGPANGEFYYHDGYTINGDDHSEISLGGLLNIPGYEDVVISAFDPAPTSTIGSGGPNTFRAGGLIWLNNTTGARSRSYQLFQIDAPDTFGKAAGIGDVEALCNLAPIEIGNRVWLDVNGNGVQDPDEGGIGGVTVRLYKNDVLLATANTDLNGEYYFIGGTAADPNTTDNIGIVNGPILPNMAYEVRIDNPADFGGGGPLNGLVLTIDDQTSQLGFDEGSDSDASLVTNPTNSPAGVFPVTTVTTGGNGDNNHNIDTGFAPAATFSLGNRIWYDTNNNGQIDAAEVGISGVSVSVLNSVGGVVNTVSTDSNGYYRFDGLATGDYTVRINASNFANGAVLAGYQNTTITDGSDNDSTLTQNGENGINPGGPANSVQTNGIVSGTITLGSPGEPTSETDVASTGPFAGQGTIDPAANMTVDFGFYCLSLSGTLWLDNGAGGGGADNGILDGTEPTLAFVSMRLFDSAGNEIPVGNDGILGTSDDASASFVSNSSGNYTFRCLPPGQYRVVVDGGGTSSTPTSLNPDDNVDSDDNGDTGSGPFTGSITSGLVTLTPGNTGAQNNNTVNNSNGTTSDPTVDFGFVSSPTSIKLEGFEVFTNGTEVSVEWQTGEEFNNLGFNVYREVNGIRELINKAPIAGSSLKSSANLRITGDNYLWQDKNPKAGAVYYLEDIDMNGQTKMHGPVYPQMKYFESRNINPLEKMNSPLLTEMTRTDNTSAQKEFIRAKASTETSERLSATVESTQWDIAGQFGAKISVREDGWYRISSQDLASIKFDPNTDRANWQLFADGVEVPMKVGADGTIEFYGQGLDTQTADTRIYYLIMGDSPGMRLTQVDGGSAGNSQVAPNFEITVERKDRLLYFASILNGDEDNWFGPIVRVEDQTMQELAVHNMDDVGQARLSVKLQGVTLVEHQVNVRFNGIDLGVVELSGKENRTFNFDLPINLINEGANQLTLQSVGQGNDISLVDTVRLTYPRRFEAFDDKLRFSIPAGQAVRFGGFSEENISLFEINGSGRVDREVLATEENSGGSRTYSLAPVNYDREMLAITDSRAEVADMLEQNIPSSWNKSTNEADFVIIVPFSYYKYTEEIAFHRRNQGLQTKVVYVEDLYDEFSFGAHSPDAIKRFLERATTTWHVAPQYALLFGDSSFDPRNYLGQTDLDLIPTKLIDTEFLETASDGWLADFDNNGVEDIAIGRLPVSNETDAENIIEKWLDYDRQQRRTTRTSVMVADRAFETYNDTLEANLPDDVQSTRIERSVLTDSQMREAIISNLNNNPQVVTYTGHGATGVWSTVRVFSIEDVENIRNTQLSLYLLMTCSNGFTHSAYNSSLAEALVKSPVGGASLVWASSGTTYPNTQFQMTQIITDQIFNSDPNTRIGDMVIAAKQATQDQDVRRTWLLIGDPTAVVK